MLKDLLLSIATPFTLKRTSSRSSLSLPSSVIFDEENFSKDLTLKRSPMHSRRIPKRRLSIGDSIPKTLRRKKFNSLPDPNESAQMLRKTSRSPLLQMDPINILVVGARNVGKSALTVRFITKRYIGDYMSGDNQTYTYQSCDDKRQQSVVFLDESNEKSGESYLKTQLTEENLSWADGIMLVYDVGDIATFEYAKEVIDFMTKHSCQNESSNCKSINTFKPLLLVGNKTDLLKRRSVSEDDVKRAAETFPAWVTCDELSAAEGYDDVTNCVNTLLSKVNERRRFFNAASAKENIKTMVGSVFRHKSLKIRTRSD